MAYTKEEKDGIVHVGIDREDVTGKDTRFFNTVVELYDRGVRETTVHYVDHSDHTEHALRVSIVEIPIEDINKPSEAFVTEVKER